MPSAVDTLQQDKRSPIREVISSIRNSSFRPHEKKAKISETIREYMEKHGSFRSNGNIRYYLDKRLGNVLHVNHRDRDFRAYFYEHFGLVVTDTYCRWAMECIENHAQNNSEEATVAHLSYYDPQKSVFYFDMFNGVLRITQESIEIVANGYDDIIFKRDIPGCEPWQFTEDVTQEKPSRLHQALIGVLSLDEHPKASRALLESWILDALFRSINPTIPILAFIGDHETGKSTALRNIGKVFFGENYNVSAPIDNKRDFNAAVVNMPFLALDNMDSYQRWLFDAIATAATGGVVTQRMLYENGKVLNIPMISSIGIASRNLNLKREDIASRLLIIRLVQFDEKKSDRRMLLNLQSTRSEILSGLVHQVQDILQLLAETSSDEFRITGRMADFEEFSMRIAPSLGVTRKEMEQYLGVMRSDQQVFMAEENPFLDLLDSWLRANKYELDREHRASDLAEKINEFAKDRSIPYPRQTGTSVGRAIKGIRPTLENRYWMESRKGHGGYTLYTFKRINEEP